MKAATRSTIKSVRNVATRRRKAATAKPTKQGTQPPILTQRFDVTHVGIVEILGWVFDGQTPPETAVFDGKLSTDEVTRGVITSPISQKLHIARKQLEIRIEALSKSHSDLHDARDVAPEECYRHKQITMAFELRRDAIEKLLWFSIASEHPELLLNGPIGIRAGWEFVSLTEKWNTDITILRGNNPAKWLIERVKDIVLGKNLPLLQDDLTPKEQEEIFIGTVYDSRIKALYFLRRLAVEELLKLLPKPFAGLAKRTIEGEDVSLEECTEHSLDITVREVKNLNEVVLPIFHRFQDVTTSIFWRSVRDSGPFLVSEVEEIAVRTDWQIVKCPPDIQESLSHELMKLLLGGTPFARGQKDRTVPPSEQAG